MANPKKYRVIDKRGVVGFNGVIFAVGDVFNSSQTPAAHLKVWLQFKQVELVEDEQTEGSGQTPEKKSKKS